MLGIVVSCTNNSILAILPILETLCIHDLRHSPNLNKVAIERWGQYFQAALTHHETQIQGRAVISLAAWHKQDTAPYNKTKGQQFFWEHVRHSLASTKAADADTNWSQLAPLALALMKPPKEMNVHLQLCTRDLSGQCRRWSLRILLMNDEPAVAEIAVGMMGDDSGEVRSTAAMILSERGTERHIPVLAQALNDPEPGVREHTALALAHINSEMSVEVLITALLHGRKGPAEAAANGLAVVGSNYAIDILIQGATTRTEPQVLRQIAHALGKIGTLRCQQALQWLKRHPDHSVKQTAAYYLDKSPNTP